MVILFFIKGRQGATPASWTIPANISTNIKCRLNNLKYYAR
jgi:hypothetical protein